MLSAVLNYLKIGFPLVLELNLNIDFLWIVTEGGIKTQPTRRWLTGLTPGALLQNIFVYLNLRISPIYSLNIKDWSLDKLSQRIKQSLFVTTVLFMFAHWRVSILGNREGCVHFFNIHSMIYNKLYLLTSYIPTHTQRIFSLGILFALHTLEEWKMEEVEWKMSAL